MSDLGAFCQSRAELVVLEHRISGPREWFATMFVGLIWIYLSQGAAQGYLPMGL